MEIWHCVFVMGMGIGALLFAAGSPYRLIKKQHDQRGTKKTVELSDYASTGNFVSKLLMGAIFFGLLYTQPPITAISFVGGVFAGLILFCLLFFVSFSVKTLIREFRAQKSKEKLAI